MVELQQETLLPVRSANTAPLRTRTPTRNLQHRREGSAAVISADLRWSVGELKKKNNHQQATPPPYFEHTHEKGWAQ